MSSTSSTSTCTPTSNAKRLPRTKATERKRHRIETEEVALKEKRQRIEAEQRLADITDGMQPFLNMLFDPIDQSYYTREQLGELERLVCGCYVRRKHIERLRRPDGGIVCPTMKNCDIISEGTSHYVDQQFIMFIWKFFRETCSKCGDTTLSLEEHEEVCPEAIINCKYCSESHARKTMQAHVRSVCREVPCFDRSPRIMAFLNTFPELKSMCFCDEKGAFERMSLHREKCRAYSIKATLLHIAPFILDRVQNMNDQYEEHLQVLRDEIDHANEEDDDEEDTDEEDEGGITAGPILHLAEFGRVDPILVSTENLESGLDSHNPLLPHVTSNGRVDPILVSTEDLESGLDSHNPLLPHVTSNGRVDPILVSTEDLETDDE